MSKRLLTVILAISMVMTSVLPVQAAPIDAEETMIFAEEEELTGGEADLEAETVETAQESEPEEYDAALDDAEIVEVVEVEETRAAENASGDNADGQEKLSGLLGADNDALLAITDASFGMIKAGDKTYNIDSMATAQSVLEALWKPSHFKDRVEVYLYADWNTKWFLRLDNEWKEDTITIDLGGHTWTVTGSERLNVLGDLEIFNGTIRFQDTCSAPITVKGGNLTVKNVTFDHCKCGSHGIFELQGYKDGTDYFDSDAYMEDCTFDHCEATSHGSCFYDSGFPKNLTFKNCEFLGCKSGNDGGALYCEYIYGDGVRFENCAFVECTSGGYGGAIYFANVNDPIVFNNCFACRCDAERGGFLSCESARSEVLMHFCTGRSNTVVYNCHASDYGGAVYAKGECFLLEDFFFYQNSANYGGAIYVEKGEKIEIRNNRFYGNYAVKTGGACYTDAENINFADNTFWTDSCGGSAGKELEVCQKQNFSKTSNNTIWSDSAYSTLIKTKTNIPGFSIISLGTSELEGSGTKDSPYLIRSAEDLYQLAINTQKGTGTGANVWYRLDTDIENFYVGIGTQARPFMGHFDGGMHRVSLRHCGDTGGLFSYAYQAEISNLITDGIVMSSSLGGGIASMVTDSAITNCTNYANIVNIGDGAGHVGGIAGGISGKSLINHCKNLGNIFYTQSENRCGGICGSVEADASVYNSQNYEKIENAYSVNESAYAGGIAAENAGHIYNCVNKGPVNVRFNGGGICSINRGRIGNCYQAGEITGSVYIPLFQRTVNDGVCSSNTGSITDCYYYQAAGCADTKIDHVTKTDRFADRNVINALNASRGSYHTYAEAEEWNLIDDGDIVFGGRRTVTLHIGNGQGDVSRQVANGSLLPELLNDEEIKQKTEQAGYRIVGWYTDNSLQEEYYWAESRAILGDLELWAKWEEYRFEVDNVFFEITDPQALTVRVIEKPDGSKYTGPLIVPDSVEYGMTRYKVTEFHVNCGKQDIDYVAFLCDEVPMLWEDALTWFYDDPVYVHNNNYDKYKAAWLDVESTKCKPEQLLGFYYLESDIHNDLHDVRREPYPAETSVVLPQPDPKPGYYLAGWREYADDWTTVLKNWFTGGPLVKDTYIRPIWLQQEVIENNVRYRISGDEFGQLTAQVLPLGDGKVYSGSVTIGNVINVDAYPVPVTAIVKDAFANCPGLKTVTVEADIPPVVEGGSLGSLPGLDKIIVPAGAVPAYKAAEGWKEYADKITGNGELYIVVTFDDNYEGAPVVRKNVQWGHQLQKPDVPKRPGYVFTGWYEDREATKAFDFHWEVFAGLTLYAGWEKSGTYKVSGIDYLWSVSADRKEADCTAVIKCEPDAEYPSGHTIRVRSKAAVSVITPADCTNGTKYSYSAAFEKIDSIDQQPENQTKEAAANDALGHMFKNHTKLEHICVRDNCGVTERHTDENRDGSCDVCGTFMYHEVILHYADGSAATMEVRHGWKVEIPQKDHPGKKSTWYIIKGGRKSEYFANYTQVTKDIELWEELTDIVYEIRWDAGEGAFPDGTKVKTASASYGDIPGQPDDPSKGETFEFAGWSPKVESVTGNRTYNAEYVEIAPLTNTVVFDSNGGTPVAPLTVVNGSLAANVAEPEKEDFVFTAWYEDEACTDPWIFSVETVEKDMTLYAGWEHEDVTLIWNAGEGSFASGEKKLTTGAAYETVPEAPQAPARSGYVFAGWYPDLEKVTEDTEYTAQYVQVVSGKMYIAAFDTNGGSEILPVSAAEGQKLTRPQDPSKEGYSFAGWYRDEALETVFDFDSAPDRDITLYAGWTGKDYDITWDANGGTFEDGAGIATTSAAYGSIPEPYGVPSREGGKFAAWTPDINAVKGNDRYTAVYVKEIPQFITVIFDTGCDAVISPQRAVTGNYLTEPKEPSCQGWTFAGWYLDKECTDPWIFNSDRTPEKAPGEVLTLYAGWELNKVTLTWDINGSISTITLDYGTVPSDDQIEAANTAAADAVTGREDVSFAGWQTDEAMIDPAASPVTQDTVYQAVYDTCEEPVYWSIDDNGLLQIASDRETAGSADLQGCFDGAKKDAAERGEKESTWESAELKAAITAVKVVGNVSVDYPEGWFDGCDNLKTAEIGGLDIRFATSLERMFGDCTSLTDVYMSGCNFIGVRNLSQMFEGCTALKSVDFGTEANIPNAVDTWQMFAGCTALEAVDISAITSGKLTRVSEMFAGCTKLKTIFVSEDQCPDYPSVTDGARMFEDCVVLTGAMGTAYDFRKNGNEYAVIDQGPAQRGYLTARGTGPFIRFCYVYFDPCNGKNVNTQLVVRGNHIRKPSDPVRSGYTFDGWYAEGESTKFDFDSRIALQSPLTLNAAWTWNGNDDPGSSGTGTVRSGAVVGDWTYHAATDTWTFAVGAYRYHDQWGLIYNPYAKAGMPKVSWFYFDAAGTMLTGWQWIRDKDGITRCYYLYPHSDGSGMRGACQLGGVTPDGYTLDASGAWTVNGVVQTK